MKNKLIWVFIVIVAINGLLMTACDIDGVSSINGVWNNGAIRITVNGSSGVYSYFGSLDTVSQSAVNNNIVKIGDQHWRNLTSTGYLQWSGQVRIINHTGGNATSSSWVGVTLTLSLDGQSVEEYNHSFGTSRTFTRW